MRYRKQSTQCLFAINANRGQLCDPHFTFSGGDQQLCAHSGFQFWIRDVECIVI